jgi:hypothetical protein
VKLSGRAIANAAQGTSALHDPAEFFLVDQNIRPLQGPWVQDDAGKVYYNAKTRRVKNGFNE